MWVNLLDFEKVDFVKLHIWWEAPVCLEMYCTVPFVEKMKAYRSYSYAFGSMVIKKFLKGTFFFFYLRNEDSGFLT